MDEFRGTKQAATCTPTTDEMNFKCLYMQIHAFIPVLFRGGPSGVELLLLRAQRRRRGQDGRSPSRYINHLKPARLGDCIEAKANPIRYLDPDAYLDKVCVPPLPPPPAACPRVTP